jgi:type III pantothenate kinase
MNLLIDIGNTSLRWALFPSGQDGNGLGPMSAVRHGRAVPPDLLAAWESLEPPERVLIGNVGGAAVGEAVARVIRAYWGCEPEFAQTRQDCLGLRVAYPEPERLGVDRWLALLAAHGHCAQSASGIAAALVVDVGTAATFDCLAPGGLHLGGLILPGIAMMRDSLLAGTHIPHGEPEPAPEPWATDTGAAVTTGSLHALAALAERVHQRLWERLSVTAGVQTPPPALLLTGGDAPSIAPLIARPLELVPDLVLRGLARLTPGHGVAWP